MDILLRWRHWIRPLVMTFYGLCLLVALPLCIIELYKSGAETHVKVWFVGGLFVMMALPISLWGILQHLIHYTQSHLQRHIIRILWMVPVYALNAWFALRFPHAAIYLDTLRECYEAYVIYNFMSYLLSYLYNEYSLEIVISLKGQVNHFFPFCLLPAWPMGREFIRNCKHGVLQYTIIRPTTTVLALITELFGKYDEGEFNEDSAWPYLVFINNASQVWAMYNLILFYKAVKEELRPINPIPKFLCVKAVVFLSFWQAVLIAFLVKTGIIEEQANWGYYSIEMVASGIQDFCICLEMFLAAIAHYFSFSHKPFVDMTMDHGNCCTSFMSMWDISDVRDDLLEHVRVVGGGVGRTIRGFSSIRKSERTPLLQDKAASVSSTSVSANSSKKADESQQSVGRGSSSNYQQSVCSDTGDANSIADIESSSQFNEPQRHQSYDWSMNNYYEASIESASTANLEGYTRLDPSVGGLYEETESQSELGQGAQPEESLRTVSMRKPDDLNQNQNFVEI
ncbi:transmembrane protein 184C-like [Argonauta hians]